MLTLCLLAATALAAGPAPTPVEIPDAPEPILELARRDVRASRKATTTMAMAALAPGVLYTGMQALSPLVEARLTANVAGAGGITLLGLGGMMVLPPLAHSHALRSRKLLKKQGLDVRSLGAWPILATTALSIASPIVLVSHFKLGGAPPASYVALSLGMYAGAMGIVLLQTHDNRMARKHAGWLSLGPMMGEGASGMALAGAW